MTILILGSTSFAAANLAARLRREGHTVWTYDRRAPDASPQALTGSLKDLIPRASAAAGRCDVIINYLLLKGADVAANLAFCDQLGELATRLEARRFIHVSSIIVADAREERVTEAVQLEKHLTHRPPYSRLKIETEHRVRERIRGQELVLVRPGFILGPGLADPMPGIGKALPTQRILGMGWRHTVIPMISREVLDDAIVKLCALPLPQRETVVQLTDKVSPTREEYLRFCCTGLGLGRGTWHFPRWFWWLGLAAASPLLAVKKRHWRNLPRMFAHNLARRSYDASASERLLGFSFHRPWRELVAEACENQASNYTAAVPVPIITGAPTPEPLLLVGLGRIVQERHLPALEAMGFTGEIEWFDPHVDGPPRPTTLRLRRLATLAESRAMRAVVATPPFTRIEIARSLPAGIRCVLFEKPFALSQAHYGELCAALEGREVFVLHNYRFKANSQRLLAELRNANAGRLLETRLHFDSPAVDHDSAAWMRAERRARTLLMDYGLHFVDLATLLAQGEAQWVSVQHAANARGQTASIQAVARFATQDCHLFLRQGARQRRCEIEYVFQNYAVTLRFFPDTFGVTVGSRSFLDDVRAAGRETLATAGKVFEKLGLKAPDPSHARVLGAFLSATGQQDISDLRLANLATSYRTLLTLADEVYGNSA